MDSKTTTFDYSSLGALQPSVIKFRPGPVIAGIFGIPLAMILIINNLPELYPFAVGLLVISFFALIVKIIFSYQKKYQKNIATLATFAAANNLRFIENDNDVSRPGSIFNYGDSKARKFILAGMINSFPFETYGYKYVTGSGKSRQEHDSMIVEITLPRVLPQFVIDSELENVLPVSFDKSQKIELEGDFHTYFNLYAPDTYGVTALTLLAPDVMAVLMERAALCDIEVVENKLYFYWQTQAQTKEQYEQLFATVQAVLLKMGDELAHKNIFATEQQSRLHTEVASHGVRLKKSNGSIYIVLLAVGYFIVKILEMTEFAGIAAILVAGFWIGVVGFVIYVIRKQSRLRKSYMQRYGAYTKKDSNQ